jgi:predicted metal-dependent peptidase
MRAMAAARVKLILGRDAKSAFFATLALRLRPEVCWDIDTIATDSRTLQYHPPFVTGLSPDELVGVVAHEVMHCALAHPSRRQAREASRWNIACDLAINPLLREAGIVLPGCRLMPGEGQFVELLPGKSAEEYYSALMNGKDEDGDGDQNNERSGTDPGGCGQVIDASIDDSAANKQVEADWRVALAQAHHAAAQRGALPGGLGRMAENVIHPTQDWRGILRQFVASHARNDYSWVRPNRRLIAHGLYLPGLHSEELGDVALAVDTSGSISEEMLGVFGMEVNAILAAYDCTVTVLYHDTEVQRVQSWHPADGPLVLEPIGGGGTSHVCVFDWIERVGSDPTCIVCLTDMESEFPSTIPSAPVLWAATGSCQVQPPFGQYVRLTS